MIWAAKIEISKCSINVAPKVDGRMASILCGDKTCQQGSWRRQKHLQFILGSCGFKAIKQEVWAKEPTGKHDRTNSSCKGQFANDQANYLQGFQGGSTSWHHAINEHPIALCT